MSNVSQGKAQLSRGEVEKLNFVLGVVPTKVNGYSYTTRVRRGEIERRRITLLKAEKVAPGVNPETHELFRLARMYRQREGFQTLGWAVRVRETGDYFIYSEVW
jgi:hypothetical protein